MPWNDICCLRMWRQNLAFLAAIFVILVAAVSGGTVFRTIHRSQPIVDQIEMRLESDTVKKGGDLVTLRSSFRNEVCALHIDRFIARAEEEGNPVWSEEGSTPYTYRTGTFKDVPHHIHLPESLGYGKYVYWVEVYRADCQGSGRRNGPKLQFTIVE